MAKSTTTKAASKVEVPVQQEIDFNSTEYLMSHMYVVEENIPMPEHARQKSDKWAKIKDVMGKMQRVGMAFVIERVDAYKIGSIANEFYPEWKFKVVTIKDNPEFKRVFRTA